MTYAMRTITVLALSIACFGQLPNHKLTPGVIRVSGAAGAKEICAPTFRTGPWRKTNGSTKKHICAEYGVKRCPVLGEMEIDHLIPLELGGADDPANLWVQFAEYADGSPGFHVKDKLENELHRRVCKEGMSLPAAQQCLRDNWIRCYKAMFPQKPAPGEKP